MIATWCSDLKPGVHQHSDLWLLLATFVLADCYTDLKSGVHQHSDFGLLLATLYLDLKPGVRILAAAGNIRPQDLGIRGPKGRRYRTLALKRRGGMGATLSNPPLTVRQCTEACGTITTQRSNKLLF